MESTTRCFLLGSFALIVCSGCSTIKEAERLVRHNEAICTAPVVGSFDAKEQWALEVPALVLKGDRARPLIGDSLALVGDSVYLDGVRQSPFVNPEPRWYQTSELVVAVDQHGKTVVGRVPRLYRDGWAAQWYIRPSGTEAEVAWMKAEGDFGYCLETGTYEVARMNLTSRDGYRIESYPGPWFSFDVEEGRTNHIGTWTLDEAAPTDSNSIIVLAKITLRPGDGGLGYAFGLAGALAEAAINSARNNEVRPVLHVSMEEGEEAVPVWDRPVRISTVTKLGPDLLPSAPR